MPPNNGEGFLVRNSFVDCFVVVCSHAHVCTAISVTAKSLGVTVSWDCHCCGCSSLVTEVSTLWHVTMLLSKTVLRDDANWSSRWEWVRRKTGFRLSLVRFACLCSWRDHRPSPRFSSFLISWPPKAKSQINERGDSSGSLSNEGVAFWWCWPEGGQDRQVLLIKTASSLLPSSEEGSGGRAAPREPSNSGDQ